MADYVERRFPVFRVGTHRDSEGNERTWTSADLDRMVSAYDPAHHEAPIVIGHPKDNSPAFGWIRGLKREDGTIYAAADLLPEFDEMVKKGLFKKRSISVYEDGTLRHIGFLGAKPPAIKGLPDIRFGEGGAVTIEVAGFNGNHTEGGTPMKFTEWIRQLAGKEGITLDDLPREAAAFSEADVEARVEAARKEERSKAEQESAEGTRIREESLAAREQKIREREARDRREHIALFCEALQKEGKLTPAMMTVGMGMTNFLESVAEIETPIEFAEGNRKVKQTPFEFMHAFLRELPKSIEFGEVATSEKDPGAGGDAEKRERLIGTYMERNPKATYKDAVLVVSRENPELFRGSE
jgi:hypothetical protein